jgi:hypothetical protein
MAMVALSFVFAVTVNQQILAVLGMTTDRGCEGEVLSR